MILKLKCRECGSILSYGAEREGLHVLSCPSCHVGGWVVTLEVKVSYPANAPHPVAPTVTRLAAVVDAIVYSEPV
jgi:hypothetical protein